MSRETHIGGSPASGTARNLARPVLHRLAIATLLFPLLLGAQKFYHDDPLEKEPAPMHVSNAAFRKLNDYFDLFSNTFAEPGERHPDKDHGDVIPAGAVNTLGEVPDSAWFTNRIGTRPMSVEAVVAGAGHDNAPSMDGQWRITGAKTEGVSPGFRITDSRDRRYLLNDDAYGAVARVFRRESGAKLFKGAFCDRDVHFTTSATRRRRNHSRRWTVRWDSRT